jgi:excisionase family DNA binding protein
MDDTLLSPEDIAERLGISRLTAVRWLRSGKLKGQKMGRKTVRMKAEDLDAFINQQQPALTLVDATAPAHESAHVPDQLGADTIALAMKLQQPGERLADVVHRALHALAHQGGSAGETLSPAQYKATMLPRLQAMQAQGLSLQTMVDRLYAEGIPSPTGNKRWHKGTLGNWLKDAQG